MTQTKSGVKVEIYGTEYRIKGEANAEYIKKVAEYVDAKMRQMAQASVTGAVSKIAILSAINIADELFRERQEKERLIGQLSDKLRKVEETGV
jgi:cell division protein ZapA